MLHNFAATIGYLAYPEKQYTFSISYHTIWLSDQCGFFDAWYTQADKREVDHKWQSGAGVRIAKIPAVCGDLENVDQHAVTRGVLLRRRRVGASCGIFEG